MKAARARNVGYIYLSTLVMISVFLPGLLDLGSGIGHLIEHVLLLVSAGMFTFSIQRLCQMADSQKTRTDHV